ncbi:MAG: CRISPR-associated endonuclease Cas1 [Clostridia bacterium]|nr:CRISPR-associated endonuclease Cas1 [Clostridia bacterium]
MIADQRTLLRRNSKVKQAVDELQTLQRKAERAAGLEELLGIEGAASRLYFEAFPSMLQGSLAFLSEGRNRRPPRDPVNALLSFGYALLAPEFTTACVAVGLEPTIGFYHAPRVGRPALALDLMEAFRTLVVDSMVLRLVNTGQIRPGHFVTDAGSCLLAPEGRRTVLGAYEARMAEEITHPLFEYRISYRRAAELEARMLARYLDGDLPAYLPLRTR